jgi:hypothetical protein
LCLMCSFDVLLLHALPSTFKSRLFEHSHVVGAGTAGAQSNDRAAALQGPRLSSLGFQTRARERAVEDKRMNRRAIVLLLPVFLCLLVVLPTPLALGLGLAYVLFMMDLVPVSALQRAVELALSVCALRRFSVVQRALAARAGDV